MNTLQQEPQVNPAFDENVLKAAGLTAQIEQKAVVIASELLDAVMVAYDEDKPNKSLIPVFIQHITEAIATARAEGAAEERKKMLTKISSCFPVEKEGDIGLFVVEHTGKLVPTMPFNDYEALTAKEHHAEE